MRKNKQLKIKISLLTILILILFVSITAGNALADMQILIDAESEVNENEDFRVSVYIINESKEIEFLEDASITFNGWPYKTTKQSDTDNYEAIITAPSVTNDRPYTIQADKQGYITNYTQITVKNIKPSLKIDPQDYIIPAGDQFYVTVYENSTDGNAVQGVTVHISSFGYPVTTEANGKAYFNAPTDREEITIIASKLGYTSGSETIKIRLKPNIISQIIDNKYFLIFVSVIILILSILFVHFRQKKNVYTRAKEISDQKTVDKYTSESNNPYDKNRFESESFIGPPVRFNQSQDSKVEEIRISRPHKEKEIVDVKTKEDETETIVNKKRIQRRDYDWFEGTDEIRYEIDKLTGEVDEEGIDKWFEGVDDLKKKIDEKMKKKKQKEEENNS